MVVADCRHEFFDSSLFIQMVKMVAQLPSITKHPLIRSAFYDL